MEEFTTHMKGAIATAPNAAIARQLQTLLDRLIVTGGGVNPTMPTPED